MKSKPNILFIITHDTGQHLGCYGAGVNTPHIDSLAAEGILFDNYHCSAPQCSPSRASIITGRYPHNTGMMGLLGFGGWKVDETLDTLPKMLNKDGYETHVFGFQHEHLDTKTLGYDYEHCAYDHIDHSLNPDSTLPNTLCKNVTPVLCDFLKNYQQDKPFYASVGLFETHQPYYKDSSTYKECDSLRVPSFLPDTPGMRQEVAELNSSVRIVDYHIGRILETLHATGLADNTIVVFTTDHGIAFPKAKCSLYDAGTKTALIMRWPGKIAEARRNSDLLENIDIMPTLLALTGCEFPFTVQGQSFAAILQGGIYAPRNEIFTEITWHDKYVPKRAVRTNRYKLIKNFKQNTFTENPGDFWTQGAAGKSVYSMYNYAPDEYELYDLACDPYEQHNIFNNFQHKEISAELAAKLEKWMKETDDPLLSGDVDTPEEYSPKGSH